MLNMDSYQQMNLMTTVYPSSLQALGSVEKSVSSFPKSEAVMLLCGSAAVQFACKLIEPLTKFHFNKM